MTKRTIPAGEFKAKCLELIDDVRDKGDEIVITKRGKPAARLTAVEAATEPKSLYGYMKGTIKVLGDIVEPLDVEWEAMSEDPFRYEKAPRRKRKGA
jgi:prevent-host-death family protein